MLSFIKKLFSILVPVFFITGCQSTISKKESFKPRIAIAGLAIESSTFSPAKTGVDAFLAREGEEVYSTTELFSGNRNEVRYATVECALINAIRLVKEN